MSLLAGSPTLVRIMTSISIFGVTGSVGSQTAELVANDPKNFQVDTVTAGHKARELAEVAKKLSARHCVIKDPTCEAELGSYLSDSAITYSSGADQIIKAAQRPVDISVQAIVGFDGVLPSLRAAEHSKKLALANKETIVCGI